MNKRNQIKLHIVFSVLYEEWDKFIGPFYVQEGSNGDLLVKGDDGFIYFVYERRQKRLRRIYIDKHMRDNEFARLMDLVKGYVYIRPCNSNLFMIEMFKKLNANSELLLRREIEKVFKRELEKLLNARIHKMKL